MVNVPIHCSVSPLSLQLFYLVSVCLCVAIIVAFQLTAFTFRENLVATALLLALFGYVMRNTAAELSFVFRERKPLRMALNLLSASWFSVCWSNYVASTRAAEQTSLSGMMNALEGGKGWHGRNEDGIGPVSERPSSCLTNLCSGKWILCYSHFDINRGLKYIIQLARKLRLWRFSCKAVWHIFFSLSYNISSLEVFCVTSITFSSEEK